MEVCTKVLNIHYGIKVYHKRLKNLCMRCTTRTNVLLRTNGDVCSRVIDTELKALKSGASTRNEIPQEHSGKDTE